MNKMSRDELVILLLLASGILMPKAAFAYLDPGTGSLLIQILIAGFFASLITVKMWFATMVGFFVGRFSRKTSNDNDEK
jgi:hypothetical protein